MEVFLGELIDHVGQPASEKEMSPADVPCQSDGMTALATGSGVVQVGREIRRRGATAPPRRRVGVGAATEANPGIRR
jgi:hypothetical protein